MYMSFVLSQVKLNVDIFLSTCKCVHAYYLIIY